MPAVWGDRYYHSLSCGSPNQLHHLAATPTSPPLLLTFQNTGHTILSHTWVSGYLSGGQQTLPVLVTTFCGSQHTCRGSSMKFCRFHFRPGRPIGAIHIRNSERINETLPALQLLIWATTFSCYGTIGQQKREVAFIVLGSVEHRGFCAPG